MKKHAFLLLLVLFIFQTATAQISLADGFDYPIGDRGIDVNGYPYELSEYIASGTCNNLYPAGPVANPSRSGSSSGWYNVNDVGNFVTAGTTDGVHPGEDWNYGSGCDDAGEEVYVVAHGVVESIQSTWSSYTTGGWTIIVRHELPDGQTYYSVYSHVTTSNNEDGALCTSSNQFTIAAGDPIYRGNLIARIAKGNNCTGGNSMSSIPTHLHFEIRNDLFNGVQSNLYLRDNGNGYYGGTLCSGSCNSGTHPASMTQAQVTNAYTNMLNDGVIDPSDFIDNHRPGKINNGLDIYAGSTSFPKEFDVTFPFPHGNFTISNVKIFDATTTFNLNHGPVSSPLPGIHKFHVTFPSNPTNLSNCYKYNIAFTITSNTSGSVFKGYGKDQVYFINSTCRRNRYPVEVANSHYAVPYMTLGYKTGFLKGIPYSSYEIGNLGIEDNLTKGEAVKLVFVLATKTGVLSGVNMDVADGRYKDLSFCDWYFPYAQTLLNAGFDLDVGGDDMFHGMDNISFGEFSHWLKLVFDIQENCSDPGFNCTTTSNYTCSNSLWQNAAEAFENAYIKSGDKILSIGKLQKKDAVADCNENIKKGDAMRLITGVWLYELLSNAGNKGGNVKLPTGFDVTGWNVIGSQARSDYTTSQSPGSPATYSVTITENETWQSNTGPLQDSYGNDLYYYWSVDGGTLNSLLPNHNKVEFVPPNVTTTEDFIVYVWLGNDVGNYAEAELTITVTPAGGSPQAPTMQASGLYFTNIINTSVKPHWTRGNGDKVLVTCTPCGQNISPPADGVDYNYDSNYNLAPTIGNSRIVYEGTANNRSITGLTTNSCYVFAAYEFNGTGNGTLYLRSNVPQEDVTTSGGFELDFEWDPPVIVEDEPVDFDWISSLGGLSIEEWTFQGGTPPTENGNGDNIYFYNPGIYEIQLDGFYGPYNEWKTVIKYIEVLSTAAFVPDFLFSSASLNTPSVVPGGQLTANWQLINDGVDLGKVTWIKYYLSDDDQYDVSDTQFAQQGSDYQGNILSGGQTLSGSRNLTIPSGTPAGNKYILIKIESEAPLSGSEEQNFSNNWVALPLTVIALLPDLTLLNISLSQNTVASGQPFDATVTFTNAGNAWCCPNSPCINYDIYLSTDNVWSPDDGDWYQGLFIDNGSWCVASYHVDTPGETLLHSRTIKTMDVTPSGSYYLIFVFDTQGEAVESNENNNVFAIPLTVANPNQPSVQASGLHLISKTSNSATLGWTPGNGAGRCLMAIRQGHWNNPVDGYDYLANTNWPDAGRWIDPDDGLPLDFLRIVYEGNGTQATITGLDPDKTWYFALFEYNGSGSGRDYNQTGNDFLAVHLHSMETEEGITYLDGDIFDLETIVYDVMENDSMIVTVGSNGFILRSLDQGASYKMKHLGFSASTIVDAEIVGNRIVGIDGSGSAYISMDAGLSWTKVLISSELTSVYAIYMIDELTCLVGGRNNDGGLNYRSTDGGLTWGLVYSQPSRSYDFATHPDGTVWACGTDGNLLKSFNGGISWTEVSDNLPAELISQIQFVSPTECYARSTSALYKSTDGGITWSSVIPYSGGGVSDQTFYFYNPQTGFIFDLSGANSGKIRQTMDGGATWTEKLTYTAAFNKGLVNGHSNTFWYYGAHVSRFNGCSIVNFFQDSDNDGYGNPAVFLQNCFAPVGYVNNDDDCDDTDPLINTGNGSCATCDDGLQNGDETGVDCGGSACVPCCPAYLSVSDPTIVTGTYQAQVELTSTGFIPSGSTVFFQAGSSITLLAGFSAEGIFEVSLVGCED